MSIHNVSITLIQREHREWSEANFDPSSRTPALMALGITEEVGELAHSVLKSAQGIRGTSEKFDAIAKDALGDMFIFMLGFCNARGWNLEDIIGETWERVQKRNWRTNTENGGDTTPTTQGQKQDQK